MRPIRTDYWLWVLVTAGVTGGLAVGSISRTESWPDRLRWVEIGFGHVDFVRLSWNAIPVVIGAAAAGWVVHAALLRFGVRLTGRPEPAQATDFADPPNT